MPFHGPWDSRLVLAGFSGVGAVCLLKPFAILPAFEPNQRFLLVGVLRQMQWA